MHLRDRTFGWICAVGVLLGAFPAGGTASAADAYPARPIRIIVPFPPGAITDAMSRKLATELGKVIDQAIVVENKPGAATVIGTQAVKSAPADGYTVLFQLSSLATNVYLLRQPGYSLPDFKPVAMLGQSAMVLIASKKFSSLPDLVVYGKANPAELNCSGTGDGVATVIGSRLKQAAGIDWALINYKGGAEAVQAVMTGDVDFSLPTQAAPLIYANPDKLNVLAITSKKRVEFLPDVPTFAELGYPAIDAQTWFGLFVRSETPPAVIDKLKSALADVLRLPSMQEEFRKLRISPYEGALDDVPARLEQELVDFTREAKKFGIEPQ
ncbi:tripartite tricarboxylate transporter substrate binding protein [Bradyrhizobium sp. LHD-71]|uniref:Bug family tripartite tricarboxylate transporter substrate binding protein n=1 Tax=Bradyrhizobium sp. LHD-71 TaxID=3072141 RepID=UPI00280F6F17|nr:tripartite tricarboxylate transporter substrate binding protein [Bradyrhizobium sp. LHD-71]MDQ8728064.1 tripartite tricarboxylate transporter substrate binding protein [Bradyrhizobium sp. LHD-71]